jgi:hypothetical protein
MTEELSPILKVMLQEQNQYREEVRMFDTHLFRVMLTYVTGVIAAFGWLGSQVLRRSAELADAAAAATPPSNLSLGTAVTRVFSELTQGPFFYLFTGVPIITAIMFLVVARDWASLNEKFNHLKDVSDRIAKIVVVPSAESLPDVLKLDRGWRMQGRRLRAFVEGALFLFWFVVALTLSLIILLSVVDSASTTPRKIWYFGAGWFGLALGFASIVVAGVAFLKRPYKQQEGSKS